ncbi:MAG: ATP-grasp domain-containing protein [Acidimicrobiales bacterium]
MRVVLLLPSSTYRAADFLSAAAAVGAEVVVASDQSQALAAHMGDRALELDFSDPEAAAAQVVEAARHRGIDAVVGVDDQGVLIAALASSRLGLPHNDPLAVARTRDKAAMREVLRAGGVNGAGFAVVEDRGGGGCGYEGLRHDLEAAAGEVGFPCVVKPVSLSGSRGVIKACDIDELVVAARRSLSISAQAEAPGVGGQPCRASRTLVVETYIPGDEIAVEALLEGSSMRELAIFDKPDPLTGPYFEETIYVTPSRHSAPLLREALDVVEAGARAIGLSDGPVHAELRLGPGGPALLEIAARSIGGLCSRTLVFGTGASLEEVLLRHALGLPPAAGPAGGGPGRAAGVGPGRAAGVMMIPIPGAGRLEEVAGLDDARAVDGVVEVDITIARGSRVVPLPEGDRYLGFILARGAAPEGVEASLREAHSRLSIRLA